MWQRWLVIGLVLLVIGVVVFEESTTPDKVKEPPKQEKVVESSGNDSESDGDEAPSEYSSLDQQAEFPGGNMRLKMWLAENIRYPQTAIELGIEGKAYVQFIVDKNGNVRNPVIIRGVPDCPAFARSVFTSNVCMFAMWSFNRSGDWPV